MSIHTIINRDLCSKICLYGGGLGLLIVLIAIVGYRLQFWSFGVSTKLLIIDLSVNGLLLLGSIALIAISTAEQHRSILKRAVASLLILVLPAIFIINHGLQKMGVPSIHDITTDVDDPPSFHAVIPLRGKLSNSLRYEGHAVAQKQLAAYPDIKTIITDRPVDDAFARAIKTAEELGWNIVAKVSYEGRIEAIDTTAFFRFKDDVVIRVRSEGDGSRIDLRSVSRIGRSDHGVNAARIRSFIDGFDSQ